eukprot:gene76-445_t
MKTFMSMIAVAGAVSTKQRLSSQLDLVIGELQKLHDDYSVALDNTTTTNAAFQTTCSMEQATMEQTIDAAKKRSSNLQMQAQTAQEGHLVAKHNAETAGSQLEMQTSAQEKATEIRGAEKAEYTPKKQQCTETIDALRNTKNHLSSQMSAGSFLDMKKVSPKVRSLLQQEPSMDNFDLGDADAGSQSALKKINDIVLSLYDDWSKECDELTQTELTSQQNYDLNTQQFGHQKSMLENEIKQETAVAAEQQAAMTQANADNQATLKQIDSVQNEMKASKTECVRVDNESNERAQELRTAIQAVVTAVDKLSQRRASFVEVATSLLQIRTLSTDNDVRTRVSDSLMKTAKSFDNKDISNLAMQVKAVGLDKVATMIREMITRLQQQKFREGLFRDWIASASLTAAGKENSKPETIAATVLSRRVLQPAAPPNVSSRNFIVRPGQVQFPANGFSRDSSTPASASSFSQVILTPASDVSSQQFMILSRSVSTLEAEIDHYRPKTVPVPIEAKSSSCRCRRTHMLANDQRNLPGNLARACPAELAESEEEILALKAACGLGPKSSLNKLHAAVEAALKLQSDLQS